MADRPAARPGPRPGATRYALFHLFFWLPAGLAFPFFFPLLATRGLRPPELGLVAAAQAVGALLAQPVAGWLSDRTGRARAVLAALTLASGAVLPLFALVRGTGAECAVGALFALCNGPAAPLGDALTVAYLRRYGGEYGRLRWWGSAAFAAGAVAAGVALQAGLLSLPGAFLLAGALFALPAAAALGFPVEVHGLVRARAELRALGRAPRFLAFLALATLAMLPLNANWTYVSVYLRQLGGGFVAVGASWALAAATEAPFFFALAATERRLGAAGALALSFACGAGGIACIALARGPRLALAGMALQGPAFAIFYGAAVAGADRLVPAGLRASGQSLLWAAAFGVGAVGGNGLASGLARALGLPGLYRTLALLSLATGAGFVAFVHALGPAGGAPPPGAAGGDPGARQP